MLKHVCFAFVKVSLFAQFYSVHNKRLHFTEFYSLRQ